MNVIDYINKYGEYTFKEKPLTEIDKLVFALLSYVKYDGTVATNHFDKRTINEVANNFFNNNDKDSIKSNISSIKFGIKLLGIVKDKIRYKDLYMYNDTYIGDEKKQFSAVCIEINPKLVYVSFEGTDQLISGWEEDGELIYKFPVPSQKYAIMYLNEHFLLRDCKIIVGGHSKGGNLALVASMYCNFIVRNKILEVYSYDGPGLRTAQILSPQYKKIKDRFKRIIPNSSVVGMILLHEKGRVIKAKGMSFLTHNAATWQINEDDFVDAELNNFSKMLEETLTNWIQNYTEEERKHFIKQVFKLFKKNNIVSLIDLKKNHKLIIELLKSMSDVSDKTKEMAKELINMVVIYDKERLKHRFFKKES